MPADEGGGDCGSLTAEDGGCPRLDDVRDGINRPLPDWSLCQGARGQATFVILNIPVDIS